MASPGSEFNYACKLCPRTFKLQEFYNKHEKVHQLKKQHVCKVCGFVYGAAKGLEGHMDSAHPEPVSATHSSTPPVVRRIEQPEDLSPQIPEMPFFHFLQAQGLLTSNEVYKQAQQAMMAQMTNTTKNLQLVPISITAPASPSPTGSLSQKPNDKSKIPSPAGTGNYKIYGESFFPALALFPQHDQLDPILCLQTKCRRSKMRAMLSRTTAVSSAAQFALASSPASTA